MNPDRCTEEHATVTEVYDQKFEMSVIPTLVSKVYWDRAVIQLHSMTLNSLYYYTKIRKRLARSRAHIKNLNFQSQNQDDSVKNSDGNLRPKCYD